MGAPAATFATPVAKPEPGAPGQLDRAVAKGGGLSSSSRLAALASRAVLFPLWWRS